MKKKKLWQRLGVLLLMTSVLAGSIPVNGYAAEAEAVVESSEAELIQEEILPEIPVKTEPETDPELTESVDTEGQPEDEKIDERIDEKIEEEIEETEEEKEAEEETEEMAEAPEELKEESEEESEDTQYHFTEDDLASVARWRELYLPNGYEDLEQYDDTWWDQLYDYERDLAEYLKDLNVELSDQVYMDQSLDECIAIMESGVPPETFFGGTIYQGLSLEDFYEFREAGYTMEDLYEQWEPIQSYALS